MSYFLFQSGPTLQCASLERIRELGRATGHITVFLKPPEAEAVSLARSSAFSHAYYEDGAWHRLEESNDQCGEENRGSPRRAWWRKVPLLRSLFG
jgi:hypothetical protein